MLILKEQSILLFVLKEQSILMFVLKETININV